MTYNTDQTLVVVGRVGMVMGHRREGRKKEKQNEKSGKVIVPVHGAPFTHEYRLVRTLDFVKKLFISLKKAADSYVRLISAVL